MDVAARGDSSFSAVQRRAEQGRSRPSGLVTLAPLGSVVC
jgi:hypothetical protein